MSLATMESAVMRLCFAPSPDEADLALLEGLGQDRERWLLYRHLVRTRLRQLARASAKRTVKAVAPEEWKALVDDWMAASAPRTRTYWRVANELAAFALPRLGESEGVPAWAADMLRYDNAIWNVRFERYPDPPETVDFTFERPPVPNPALVLLELDYPVNRELAEGETVYPRERTHLAVVRRPSDGMASTWTLNPMAAQLLATWREGTLDMTESVKRVAEARGAAIDQAFVEKLGEMLAGFLERGILLGSLA